MTKKKVPSGKVGLRALSVGLMCFAFAGMQSCKKLSPSVAESMTADNTESSGVFETLTAVQNTSLKTSLLQSEGLGAGDVCPIPQGTVLLAEAIKAEGIQHWRIFEIFEVKLPTGETGRRKRDSNESDTPPQGAAPAATGTPAVSVTSAGAPAPAVTPSATATPAAEATPAAAEPKTPAQLLGCELLNRDSLLVYAPHFNRLLKPNSPQIPSAGTTTGEIDPDDQSGFVWPTRGRKIRSDAGGDGYFGAPRGWGRSHQGLDIVAAVGEPIYATRAGTIIDPAYEASYGRVLDVRHQGGYSSRYAHLNSFSYSHGAYVGKGERIAASGKSGNASGYLIIPHLHFEIRRDGRLMNPAKLLP